MLYRRRTPAQIAASRRNGALSHGPVTPAAKRNPPATTAHHARIAKSILLPGESEADFTRVVAQLEARFNPRDAVEGMLVQRMIVAQWHQIRTWKFERLALHSAPQDDSEDPNLRSLDNFLDLHTKSRAGNVFQTSIQRYQRQFDRAIAQLERLRGNLNFRTGNPTSDSKQTNSVESGQPTAYPPDLETNLPATHPGPPPTQAQPKPAAPQDAAGAETALTIEGAEYGNRDRLR